MFKIKAPDGRNNISGKKVKQYRLAKKMSQYKLAAKIQAMGYDVDNHFIRRIENGERFVTDIELVILSEVLGVSIDDLYCPPRHRFPLWTCPSKTF